MAVRTNDDAVKEVLEHDPTIPLRRFIWQASLLTDWLETEDTNHQLSAKMLEAIECLLAAHFYSHWDQQLQAKGEGAAQGTFQGQTSMVLLSSQYGQDACALDVTNRLAQRSQDAVTGQSRTASMAWLGGGTNS